MTNYIFTVDRLRFRLREIFTIYAKCFKSFLL